MRYGGARRHARRPADGYGAACGRLRGGNTGTTSCACSLERRGRLSTPSIGGLRTRLDTPRRSSAMLVSSWAQEVPGLIGFLPRREPAAPHRGSLSAGRKLRAHALPDDELLAGPVPLDPSASDSTVAVHADGVVALSVERHSDELRRSGRQNPGSLGPRAAVGCD